jgi:hypothetical protein
VSHPSRILRAVAVDQGLKVVALEVFHGVVESASRGTTEVVDRDRVGMRESAGELGFALKVLEILPATPLGWQQLDRCRSS